jgi:hypothetical protein
MKRDQIKPGGQSLQRSRVARGRFIRSFKRITQVMPKRFFAARSKRIASQRISASVKTRLWPGFFMRGRHKNVTGRGAAGEVFGRSPVQANWGHHEW